MKKKITFLLVLSTLGCLFWEGKKSPVFSQDPVALTVSPPRIELTANPGETITKDLKITNNTASELLVQTTVKDFLVEDKKGTPITVKSEQAGKFALSTWLSTSETEFSLPAYQTKLITAAIVIPEEAFPGGHYGAIYFSPLGLSGPKGAGAETTSQTGVATKVASLVSVIIPGDIKEDAIVRRMDIPLFQEFGPVKIISEIANSSDIHIRPLGTIRIYNWLGKLNTTLKLKEQNIFPGASRTYKNLWPQKWGLGKYKAKLEAGYGNQGNSLLAIAYFWVIPWRLIVVVLLVVTLIILSVIYWRKKKNPRI